MNNDFSPRIGFIGAGRVGTTLGKYFSIHGIDVAGYYSRTSDSAREAASFTDTLYYENISELINECNMVFITVPDGQIADIWNEVSINNITGKIICHCSGAMSSLVFSDITGHGAYGYSIHPLCSVHSHKESYKNFDNVFFTVEGHEDMLENVTGLISSLGNPVATINSDKKTKYHAAAVFASNLTIGLYHTASELLKDCGLDEIQATKALSGLFLGNCNNIVNHGTVNALTGPIDRNDIGTIKKHLGILDECDARLYKLLSLKLIEVATDKNPNTDYSKMTELLYGKDLKL